MQRRKPISAKQRKEQLQLKRAVKRGDIPQPPPSKPDKHRKGRRGPTGQLLGSASRSAAAESSRRLESSFVKLPPEFLDKTKVLASTLPLTRPIPAHLAILSDVDKPHPGAAPGQDGQLTCPKRPKWRYDMSKKEVEANEEGLFRKWLAQTDASVSSWCDVRTYDGGQTPPASAQQGSSSAKVETPDAERMPRAPTSFERNLEVWRQLWRVTEISQILLILLDSRCPPLHFPPALSAYLSNINNVSRVRTILVLTKVDISGPDRAAAWTRYLSTLYPSTRVIQVESYTEKFPDGEGPSSNPRKRLCEPHLPSAFRQTLVDALRETHAELLEPPPAVKSNPDRLASWKPRAKSDINWDAVLKAHGAQVGTAVGGAAAPKPIRIAPGDDAPENDEEYDDAEPDFLTIGLIGQPNVGKSSLLNALFGTQKVRASRTPGKTKHFQTLFWTSEVRLVDCPGLVIPNYVPMEIQVLSGILPISRVSAIPLCIYHAAELLPLETILGLTHPSLTSPPPEDKRTWREGMRPGTQQQQQHPQSRASVWTAMDILTAYANKKGWVTAKAGRPDVNRAGNAILRALAEGRIRWAFWPPGTDLETIRAHQRRTGSGEAQLNHGDGIWIAHGGGGQDVIDAESEDEDEDERPPHPAGSGEDETEDASGESGEEESEDVGSVAVAKRGELGERLTATSGRFGVLVLDDDFDHHSDRDGGEEGSDASEPN